MTEKTIDLVNHQNVEEIPGSTLTKAGRLQRELTNEKKRLAKELEELQAEYDEVKPTTPTGTKDWYIKWVSMILAVSGIFLISASYLLYGQVAYLISSVGWIYVGMQWGDRAIMIGSAISGTAVAMHILSTHPIS
jgi:hypothetical protein|tara:strand:+ start:586 stop:990 length:405 start_codon:yes stop_codon:yes gene_type:complete